MYSKYRITFWQCPSQSTTFLSDWIFINCRIDTTFTRVSCKLRDLLKDKINVDRICFVCFTNANTDLGVGYPENIKQKSNEAKSITAFFRTLSDYPTHWSWINIQVRKISSLHDQAINITRL